jgi:hypothetical protein
MRFISWHGVGTVGVVCGNLRALLLVVGSRISFFRFLIFHTKSFSFLSLYSAKLYIPSEIARESTYVGPYERVQRADSLVGGSILSIGIPRGRELIGEQNSERARQILPSVRVLNYVGVLPN